MLFCTEGIFNHDFLFHIFNIVKTGALRSFDKFSRNVNDISVLEYCLLSMQICCSYLIYSITDLKAKGAQNKNKGGETNVLQGYLEQCHNQLGFFCL